MSSNGCSLCIAATITQTKEEACLGLQVPACPRVASESVAALEGTESPIDSFKVHARRHMVRRGPSGR